MEETGLKNEISSGLLAIKQAFPEEKIPKIISPLWFYCKLDEIKKLKENDKL